MAGLPAGFIALHRRVVTILSHLSHSAPFFSYLAFAIAVPINIYCDFLESNFCTVFWVQRVHGVNDEIEFHWMSACDVII